MASEYAAFSKGNTETKWLNSILQFYGNPKRPYHGYIDNQEAKILATNPAFAEALVLGISPSFILDSLLRFLPIYFFCSNFGLMTCRVYWD